MKSAQTQAWADHLRRTTKKQGRGYLAQKDPIGDVIRYCCMGFGCTLIPSLQPRLEAEGRTIMAFEGNTMYPPRQFLLWLGFAFVPDDTRDSSRFTLRIDWPMDIYSRTPHSRYLERREFNLDALNDNSRFTFAQIGDMIAYFGVKGGWET